MLLDAAWGFHTRGINVSVIVIDYMHWKHMGDYTFDPEFWPDVPGMMANLSSIGMKVMVSAWPFQATNSTSIDHVRENGLAVTVQGTFTLTLTLTPMWKRMVWLSPSMVHTLLLYQ
jgi:alpha-D-xyloside xylohydrolase